MVDTNEIKDDIKIDEEIKEDAEYIDAEYDEVEGENKTTPDSIGSQVIEDLEYIKQRTEKAKETIKAKAEERHERREEQFAGSINKGKEFADTVGNNIGKTFENAVYNLKEIHKNWDERIQDYKENGTIQIPIDLVNAKDYYYVQAALAGAEKEDIELEASESSITIKATFKNIFKNIESPEGLEPELMIKGLKTGNGKRTIQFANEIQMEEISAKFQEGCLFIEIPKVEVAKTKINID